MNIFDSIIGWVDTALHQFYDELSSVVRDASDDQLIAGSVSISLINLITVVLILLVLNSHKSRCCCDITFMGRLLSSFRMMIMNILIIILPINICSTVGILLNTTSIHKPDIIFIMVIIFIIVNTIVTVFMIKRKIE